jgi:hypothetical protein
VLGIPLPVNPPRGGNDHERVNLFFDERKETILTYEDIF